MGDEEDYGSDSSDDDYVPVAGDEDGSGLDSGSDLSDKHEDDDEEGGDDSNKKSKRKKKNDKKGQKSIIKKRKTKRGDVQYDEDGNKSDVGENEESVTKEETNENTEEKEKEKEKADSLWADFKKDTGFVKKNDKLEENVELKKEEKNKNETVKITKILNFAGEDISVTEEVKANSKEAKLSQKLGNETPVQESNNWVPKSGLASGSSSVPRPGGLGSIMSRIGGAKKKMSILEKSRLDWNHFKDDEGIKDELLIHNKGKDGYLEKQAFLQRADLREYEVERKLRMGSKSNR